MAFAFTLLLIFALPVTLLCAAMLAMLLDKPRGVMVRCRRCHYALGGLAKDAACPECGDKMRVLTGRDELARWPHLFAPLVLAIVVMGVGCGIASRSVLVAMFMSFVTAMSLSVPAIICFHRLRGGSLSRRACIAVMAASCGAAMITTGLLMVLSQGPLRSSELGMMVIFGPFIAQWIILPASVVSLFLAMRMQPADEA